MNCLIRLYDSTRKVVLYLVARVFAVDVTVCRKCGGQVRILDFIRDPDDIARILHGARAPPRPSRPHPPGQALLFPC